MALTTIFATLPAGNVAASLLDTNFNEVGAMAVTACTASGTNSIALTQSVNQPTISSYSNYLRFGFVAANTTTGSVTANVNSIGSLNVYKVSGSQAGSGDIVSGGYYEIVYNSALNASAGGFQIIGISTSSTSIVSVHSQQFSGHGTYTYTPTTGMLYCIAEGVGAGGGGGGTNGTDSSGGGGGGGGFSRVRLTAAQVGASKTVTIGQGGTAGTNTGGNGGPGGDTSVGSLLVAKGGSGGTGQTASSGFTQGGTGGLASGGTGDTLADGGAGGNGINLGSAAVCPGLGGSTFFAGNTRSLAGSGAAGVTGINFGAGGSGAGGSSAAGGAGGDGYVTIIEFCSQ